MLLAGVVTRQRCSDDGLSPNGRVQTIEFRPIRRSELRIEEHSVVHIGIWFTI